MKINLKDLSDLISSFLFPAPDSAKDLKRLTGSELEKILPRCEDSPHPCFISIFKYRNEKVKEAIYHIKFKGNLAIIDPFGEVVFREITERIIPEEKDGGGLYVIPIPLSQKRHSERGFNQSDLIALSVLKNDRNRNLIYSPKTLKRDVHTRPQTTLSVSKRRTNVKNCFSVPEKEMLRIRDQKVILVDDVTTTGSTLKEARKVLLKAGAKEVWAVTLAH